MQLNATQCNLMQLSSTQHTSIFLTVIIIIIIISSSISGLVERVMVTLFQPRRDTPPSPRLGKALGEAHEYR